MRPTSGAATAVRGPRAELIRGETRRRRRLSDTVLLVHAEEEDAILDEVDVEVASGGG